MLAAFFAHPPSSLALNLASSSIALQIGSLFLIMASFILGFIPSTCEANKGLQYIFNLLPSYALGKGLVNVRAGPHFMPCFAL